MTREIQSLFPFLGTEKGSCAWYNEGFGSNRVFILTLKLRRNLGFISSSTLKAATYCARPVRMLSISNQTQTSKYMGSRAASVSQQPGVKQPIQGSCWPLRKRFLCFDRLITLFLKHSFSNSLPSNTMKNLKPMFKWMDIGVSVSFPGSYATLDFLTLYYLSKVQRSWRFPDTLQFAFSIFTIPRKPRKSIAPGSGSTQCSPTAQIHSQQVSSQVCAPGWPWTYKHLKLVLSFWSFSISLAVPGFQVSTTPAQLDFVVILQ